MRREILRPITDDEMATFRREGVVCLRGVVDRAWLEWLETPVEDLMKADSGGVDLAAVASALRDGASLPMFGGKVAAADLLEDEVINPLASKPKFFSLTHVYPKCPEIKRFATESPLPEIAATLLRASILNLFVDQVFVKEPGTSTRTAFHVDESYFNLSGDQVCTIWAPLDVVTRDSSAMGYVRGSHLWDKSFLPNNFVTQNTFESGLGGTVERVRLPDIEHHPDDFDLVYFDVEPGDVIVHHTRTVHGSGGNSTLGRRRRALSIRYCGDDARWLASGPFQGAEVRAGERVDPAVFPPCWPN